MMCIYKILKKKSNKIMDVLPFSIPLMLLWSISHHPLQAQSYYNAEMHVVAGTIMSDLGSDAIFGSSSDINIGGDIYLLSNKMYMDTAASITGPGNINIISPSVASLPWTTHTLDANGATIGSGLVINTGSVSMSNLSYAGLGASGSYNVSVSGQVSFSAGIVSSAGGLFHFLAGSSHSGSGATSHVSGNVRKTGNTSFTFPIGNGVLYAPIGISGPASVSDHFTASYINSDPHAIGTAIDPSIVLISSCEYWNLDRTGGASPATVTMYWDASRSCGVSDPSLLRVAHWSGSVWQDKGNVGFTGSASSGSLLSTTVSSFSPFTLSSTSIVNPLPVVLDYFTAECKDNTSVLLKWGTLSEQNNDYFQPEYSSNLQDWEALNKISGAGNSNQGLAYSSTHYETHRNTRYYRLRQVDYDGQFTLYGPVSLACDAPEEALLFPNPVQDGVLYLKLPQTETNTWQYGIRDVQGKLCLSGQITYDKNACMLNVDQLAFGTYYLSITNPSYTYTFPFISINK